MASHLLILAIGMLVVQGNFDAPKSWPHWYASSAEISIADGDSLSAYLDRIESACLSNCRAHIAVSLPDDVIVLTVRADGHVVKAEYITSDTRDAGSNPALQQAVQCFKSATYPPIPKKLQANELSVPIRLCDLETRTRAAELNNSGVRKMNAKNFKGAVDDFAAGLAIAPRYPYFCANGVLAGYGLRDASAVVGFYEEARRTFRPDEEGFLLINTRLVAKCYAKRGQVQLSAGRTLAAIASFREAIKLEPSVASYYDLRGKAKEADGDKAGAAADYEQAKLVTGVTVGLTVDDWRE